MTVRIVSTASDELPDVTAAATETARDDIRIVREPRLAKTLAVTRKISGNLLLAAVFGVPFLDGAVIGSIILVSSVVYTASHWLLQWATRGFGEKEFVAVGQTPKSLQKYRQASKDLLVRGNFERFGCFKVVGSSFNTYSEFHLGCSDTVIAEFVHLSGIKAIELCSITEAGLVVLTSSCDAPPGQPSKQQSSHVVAELIGTDDFEQLLRTHLGNLKEYLHPSEDQVVPLTVEDITDVARYGYRAHHHMLFQQGKTSDRVGAASYGRFRFPNGLRATNPGSERVEEPVCAE